jgi:replication fork clamp-binding protein CrfC
VELSGGARISFVFHELYANGVKAVDPFDQVKDIDIRTILYNSSGSSPALFVNTAAFELIVKQQIKRLEEPSLKCVSLVYDELVRILTQLLSKQLFRRYPQLKEKFHQVVISFFKKTMDPTNKLVRDLVAMESCYINTGHPDFLNGHRVCHMSLSLIPKSNLFAGYGTRQRQTQCSETSSSRPQDWEANASGSYARQSSKSHTWWHVR